MTLKQLRKDVAGMYAYKVAEALGVTREQYYRIENGKAGLDKLKQEKLALLFNVSDEEVENAWNRSKK